MANKKNERTPSTPRTSTRLKSKASTRPEPNKTTPLSPLPPSDPVAHSVSTASRSESTDPAFVPDDDDDTHFEIVDTIAPSLPAKRQAISISDSGSDSDAPTRRGQKKKAKKQQDSLDPGRKLVLLIPQAGSDGTQRENLTHDTSFDKALEVIYETVGCSDVHLKPKLSYKLSHLPAKVDAINLTSEADWEGCLEEVTEAEAKKKGTIGVRILVTEQYLLSLRARLGKGKGGGGGSKKKGKVVILDLEHAQSGEDDFDEGLGIMSTEASNLDKLQALHSRCQMCGPTKACKIDVSGTHHPLSNNQLSGWARSLAAETHGVTMHTPPKARLFAMFFKKFDVGGITPIAQESVPQPQAPFGPLGPYMGGNPFGYMPWAMPGMPPSFAGPQHTTPMTPTPAHAGHSSHASSSSLSSAFPSSDPADMDAANPYPEIAAFILQLSKHHPKRDLEKYTARFEDLDFYNIDEILKIDAAELTRLVDMSAGNASFLLGQVKAEMKRVDRMIRAAKV